MPYSTCAMWAAFVPNLTNGASTIAELDAGVFPASGMYLTWAQSGCALIETRLSAEGYSVPVPATAKVYSFVQDTEATYVAYRAESSRSSPRVAPGERTRSEQFKKQFNEGLDALLKMDLSRAGMTHSATWYAGGTSQSDKEAVESDSDRVAPRFVRGSFDGSLGETSAS